MVKLLFKRSLTAGIKQTGRELQTWPQLPSNIFGLTNGISGN
jgi:hypothetical protein